MYYVGIDLHKQSITVCVVDESRKEVRIQRLCCSDAELIVAFFRKLGKFKAVVEATSSYEWLWQLLEPHAEELVLAHPGKLRVIAESTRKSDRLDARVLADFLARDMIPRAYRPTPRQREHRVLVRQRRFIQKEITILKNKLRHVLGNYNADRTDLFEEDGQQYLKKLRLRPADRFVVKQLLSSWRHHEEQLQAVDQALKAFAKKASAQEKEAREVLRSIPGVGPVTVDVVVSEIGDVRRFRSAKQVAAYAGLAPGQRESAGKRKGLSIDKKGSPLLRWALVEAAWRLVRLSRYWCGVFEGLKQRSGKKKAIVAIARRLLGVMVALLRSGQRYRSAAA
jgi:transposase